MKNTIKNPIHYQIAKGNIPKAISLLRKNAKNNTEKNILVAIEQSLNEIETQFFLGNIENDSYISERRKLINKLISLGAKSERNIVFISYNHKDTQTANKVKKVLDDNNIEVIIDSEDMKAGDTIFDFIIDSIKKADYTLSIVSNDSLLSGWVGIETVNTFFAQRFNDKKFIACYLDADFFDNHYQLKAIDLIDAEIKELEEIISGCKKRRIDSTSLNKEKTRLYNLRNSMGEILQNLKECLCIDIAENNFDSNMQRVVKTINGD